MQYFLRLKLELILGLILISMTNFTFGQVLDYSWYKDYSIKYYKIDLTVSDTSLFIKGNVLLCIKVNKPIDTIHFELGSNIVIDSLFRGEKKSSYKREGDITVIPMPRHISSNSMLTIQIYYHGMVPSSGFFSAMSTRKDYEWKTQVTWTLSEAFATKYWLPCKQYLSDKIDSATILLTVPRNRMAGSNGLLKSIVPIGNNMVQFEWKTHYPIAYYLLSLSVADYQDYSFYAKIGKSDSVLIQNYIYNQPNCLKKNRSKLNKIGQILAYFSDIFGPYPFKNEKYGQCQAPMYGGMENQTMTTIDNFELELVAHEMAHQWFGDWVTCSTWQDVWLNEGFASYSEYLALDKLSSHDDSKDWMDEAGGLQCMIPPEPFLYRCNKAMMTCVYLVLP